MEKPTRKTRRKKQTPVFMSPSTFNGPRWSFAPKSVYKGSCLDHFSPLIKVREREKERVKEDKRVLRHEPFDVFLAHFQERGLVK